MAGRNRDDTERLSRIIATQREIAAAGSDLEAVMRLVLDRSVSLTGADGAMLCLVDGDQLITRAAVGIGRRGQKSRPLASSVARHAIDTGLPLLIEDAEHDSRVNRDMQRAVGDKSLICVPLFQGPQVVGAMNVMSSATGKLLTEEDRETLEMLSVVLSAAVSHAAEFDARRSQEEALGRFRTLFDGASIGIVRSDAAGDVLEVNPAVEEMLGYRADELIGVSFRNFMHRDDLAHSVARFDEMMAGGRDSYQFERRYNRKDGTVIWGQSTAVLERDADGNPRFVISMIENITERKLAEQALLRQSELNQHQALHDALTGLANRTLFADRIEQAIRDARRGGSRLAVMVMDLDRFKRVNDSYGHHAGDILLAEVGTRVKGAVRASDTVARLGGDEFGILLHNAGDTADVVRAVERICAAFELPVSVEERPLSVEASLGISVYPDNARDMDTLLQLADLAMYASKQGGSRYAFYDEDTTALTPRV
jgi:diguanylate cyclase (GGDEF)-like protein/PAS domain S-box-containing protein